MAKKNNLKSVRISDEVMRYILNFEGEGFNQKFENLVLFCMAQEDAKRRTIQHLEREIARERNQYYSLVRLQAETERTIQALNACLARTRDFTALLEDLPEPGLPFS